jgi:hypothetical protein
VVQYFTDGDYDLPYLVSKREVGPLVDHVGTKRDMSILQLLVEVSNNKLVGVWE